MRAKFAAAKQLCILLTLVGCASDRAVILVSDRPSTEVSRHTPDERDVTRHAERCSLEVQQAAFLDDSEFALLESETRTLVDEINELTLPTLEQIALDQNPQLKRLYQESQAAAARSQYVDKLPDPKLGTNIFGNPIETASGSQLASINLSQMIPWLGRLNAEQQRACFEALAVRAELAAERLRVIADVRLGWYRLYVVDRQIASTEANQELLESLIDVANSRIATGKASQGDVLLGTLELSQLEEKLLTLRRQRRRVEAEINRLVARPAETSIRSAAELSVGIPELTAAEIHQIALISQPEIAAARLRMQATRSGIEIARLSRRPELTLSASYFFTDNNRPASSIVDVGQDPWAVGVQVSVPVWHEKYTAMEHEASWKHHAAQSSVEVMSNRYEAMIVDLLAESKRAAETAALFRTTILPQARQTLAADQQSYSNGMVEFDRVVQDYRNLLTLELGYQRAIGELALATTRIQQVAGQDLVFSERSVTQ